MRIWSICQHAWIPTVLVFSLSMVEPAINIYGQLPDFVGSYLAISSGPLAGCWVGSDIIKYKYGCDYQINLCSYRCYGAIPHLVENNIYFQTKCRGSMQFGILLLLNILAILLDILAVAVNGSSFPNASVFIYIQTVLTSIILSHFILSLRSVYHTASNSSQTSSKQSSLHFASAIEGNMGASLSGSWGSNREEDDEEDTEGVQYHNYPFAAGLADFKEVSGDENVEEIPQAGPSSTTYDSEPSTMHAGGFEEIESQVLV
ncbi:hypothetical protein QCA50_008246 [Cerrena zonata]|uniref:Uncharacterized protein n=1 Tax=Cerrena zonata TaxID=2478898 RepID=A0AAW0G5Y8_9APHY